MICPACKGSTAHIRSDVSSGLWIPCEHCEGKGRVPGRDDLVGLFCELGLLILLLSICVWMVVEWGLAPRPAPKVLNQSRAWTAELPDEPRPAGFPHIIKGGN